jgi:hypothetical protein
MLVARFDTVPQIAGVYAANAGLMSLFALLALEAGEAEDPVARLERRRGLIVLVALSLAAVALSPWLGGKALLLYALKGVSLRRWGKAAAPVGQSTG